MNGWRVEPPLEQNSGYRTTKLENPRVTNLPVKSLILAWFWNFCPQSTIRVARTQLHFHLLFSLGSLICLFVLVYDTWPPLPPRNFIMTPCYEHLLVIICHFLWFIFSLYQLFLPFITFRIWFHCSMLHSLWFLLLNICNISTRIYIFSFLLLSLPSTQKNSIILGERISKYSKNPEIILLDSEWLKVGERGF